MFTKFCSLLRAHRLGIGMILAAVLCAGGTGVCVALGGAAAAPCLLPALVMAAMVVACAVFLVFPMEKLGRAAFLEEDSLTGAEDALLDALDTRASRSGLLGRLLGRIRAMMENQYSSQLLKTQAEIHALQSQINPHFLYNTLDVIRSHALVNHDDETAEMVEALSKLFRYSISRPGELATLSEELDNVNAYFTLLQYRFPDKLRLELVLEQDDEELMGYQLPILTIQPLVENAIHHGIERKIGNGCVTIRAVSTGTRLYITVADNGMGMTEETLNELLAKLEQDTAPAAGHGASAQAGTGIALLNVHQRIKFYFGQDYGLDIQSTHGYGTTVELVLPRIGSLL